MILRIKPIVYYSLIPVLYVCIHSAVTLWFQPDVLNIESDNLLYDSKLVAEGFVPFKELFTRSLVPLYIDAGLIWLFGIHVKLSLIVVHVASGIALFLFGQSVHKLYSNTQITILAMLLLGIFGLRGFPDLFLYTGLWLVLRWREYRTPWYILLSGACVGLSVLSYSAYIVWVIIFVVFIAAHYLQAVSDTGWKVKQSLTGQLWFGLGCAITLLGPIMYFIGITDWQWMADSFLADSFIYAYIVALMSGLFATVVFYIAGRDIHKLMWLVPVLGIVMITLFFYRANPGVAVKIGVIHDFARLASWLIIPFFITFALGAHQLFKKNQQYIRPVVIITCLSFFYMFIIGAIHLGRGPSLALDAQGRIYFWTILTLFIVCFWLYIRSHRTYVVPINYWQYIVIILPAVVVFAASLTYSDWLPTYIYNYSFSLVLGASVVLVHMYNQKSTYTRQFLYVCCISLIFSYVVFPKVTKSGETFNPATQIQTNQAWQVVEYIQANTQPTDEIFTAVPFFALRSGRDLALSITHPVVYTEKRDDPKPYDPYNVIPSVTEIKTYLSEHNVQYIILDERTRSLFLTDRHPEITKYIRKHYAVVQQFGNIKILERQ